MGTTQPLCLFRVWQRISHPGQRYEISPPLLLEGAADQDVFPLP